MVSVVSERKNWRKDCPKLNELSVRLQNEFGEDKYEWLLRELIEAKGQYEKAQLAKRAHSEELRRYCEEELTVDKERRDGSKEEEFEGCEWYSHRQPIDDPMEEDKLLAGPAGVFYKKNKREGVSPLGWLEIAGWVPVEIKYIDRANEFCIPLPPERAEGLDRDLTRQEKILALVAVHDAHCPKPIVPVEHEIKEWVPYWLGAIGKMRTEADDSWIPHLEKWLGDVKKSMAWNESAGDAQIANSNGQTDKKTDKKNNSERKLPPTDILVAAKYILAQRKHINQGKRPKASKKGLLMEHTSDDTQEAKRLAKELQPCRYGWLLENRQ